MSDAGPVTTVFTWCHELTSGFAKGHGCWLCWPCCSCQPSCRSCCHLQPCWELLGVQPLNPASNKRKQNTYSAQQPLPQLSCEALPVQEPLLLLLLKSV